jgi:hypothetical protein
MLIFFKQIFSQNGLVCALELFIEIFDSLLGPKNEKFFLVDDTHLYINPNYNLL